MGGSQRHSFLPGSGSFREATLRSTHTSVRFDSIDTVIKFFNPCNHVLSTTAQPLITPAPCAGVNAHTHTHPPHRERERCTSAAVHAVGRCSCKRLAFMHHALLKLCPWNEASLAWIRLAHQVHEKVCMQRNRHEYLPTTPGHPLAHTLFDSFRVCHSCPLHRSRGGRSVCSYSRVRAAFSSSILTGSRGHNACTPSSSRLRRSCASVDVSLNASAFLGISAAVGLGCMC